MTKCQTLTLSAALALLSVQGVLAELPHVSIKGSKFFREDGSQFFVKGVAYQQGQGTSGTTSTTEYNDPLADETRCNEDVPLLKKLGVNTIRTYAIDPTADHSKCMKLLDDAGIYVISDLSEPKNSIVRENPVWDTTLYKRYTSVIDELQQYSNVIGFFAGNEVVNNLNVTASAAAVKAAVRDTKAYIKSKNYPSLGVGYAADDDEKVRPYISSYMNCDDPSTSIDFWGYNIYEWCGDSSFEKSGYSERVKEFKDYNVPTFFAEYGCNTVGGAANRTFTEVEALFGPQMSDTFSGGMVFEFFQGANDFGLVSLVNNKASTMRDFAPLATQYASASPSSISSNAYTPSNTAAQACPTINNEWKAVASPLPPTPNQDVCDCMTATLTCKPRDDMDDETVRELFGIVCGLDGKPCGSGINFNAEKGNYGAYAMCSAKERLAFAVNAYYNAQGNSDACDFSGNATVVSAGKADSSCSSIIASATEAAGSGGSGSGDGSANSSSKKSEAMGPVGASLSMGKWIALYASLAVVSGAGMIWL